MLISIGILAWNEEESIKKTIGSLFSQTVFTEAARMPAPYSWEILVVPNGCSDATARVARETLEECVSNVRDAEVGFEVREVSQPGKSNAWNLYVHEFSNQAADYLILIDADIEFGHPRTIENVLATIESTPRAEVVVDLPLKSLVKSEKKTPLEWFSTKISSVSLETPPGICGQFYCARGGLLRNIWMPIGLSNEDGFLLAMVLTDLFRAEVVGGKIVRAKDAIHYYEAESTLSGIFKHQLRVTIGSALNCFLTWDALKFTTDPDGPGAGVTIRNRMGQDPDWYRKFLHNAVLNKGWWVLPRGMLLGRFGALKRKSGLGKVRTALVLSASLLFDLPVFLLANHKIKSGRAIGYW